MEMWCPDDIGQDSWDWVGPPAWGRACFNSPEWSGGSSPVKTEPPQIVLLLLLFLKHVHGTRCVCPQCCCCFVCCGHSHFHQQVPVGLRCRSRSMPSLLSTPEISRTPSRRASPRRVSQLRGTQPLDFDCAGTDSVREEELMTTPHHRMMPQRVDFRGTARVCMCARVERCDIDKSCGRGVFGQRERIIIWRSASGILPR